MKTWKTKSGYEIIRILSGRCNTFLVSNKESFILVDTGRTNNWSRLRNSIDELSRSRGTFAALILTHTHFDHAENAAAVQLRYHVPVIVNKREAEFLRRGDNPPISSSVPVTKYAAELLAGSSGRSFRYQPVEPDVLTDRILGLDQLGFHDVSVIHTPGHTAGSQSVIVDNEIALVGDAMIGVFPQSVFPPFAEDKKLLIDSWGKLLDTGCHGFIPAHGTENSRFLLLKEYKKYTHAFR